MVITKDISVTFPLVLFVATFARFIFTTSKQSLRRLCFHRCLSVPVGVSATHTPEPGADTHPGQTPPCPVHAGKHTSLPSACWDTPPAQCMLIYGQQAGGTHPTGMHSCYECRCFQESLLQILYMWCNAASIMKRLVISDAFNRIITLLPLCSY